MGPDDPASGTTSLRRALRLCGVLTALLGALPLPARRLGPLDPRQMSPERGHAYLADVGALGVSSPSDAEGGSAIRLREGDRELTGRCQHDDIRNIGGGRFSHWHSHVYFSSTDNSDPRTNGRPYVVLEPRTLLESLIGRAAAPPARRRLVLLAGMVVAALSFASPRPFGRMAGRALACVAMAALAHLSLPASLLGLAGLGLVFALSSGRTSPPRTAMRFPLEPLGVALVAMATLALGLLQGFALATTPVGWDEGIMLAQTEPLLQGQRLYADVMTQYPPGIYLVLAPVLTLWHDLAAARLLAALVHLGIALFVAILARRLSLDPLAPWFAAGLWLASATAFEADTLMSDPFAALPALAALVCLARGDGALPSDRRSLVAGALLGLGALGKQMGVLWVLPAGLWLLVWPREPRSTRLRRLGALVAGLALVGAPTLAVLALRPRALFCTVVFPLSDRYPSETTWALLQTTFTAHRWTIVLPLLMLAAAASWPRWGSTPGPPIRGLHLLLWLSALLSSYPFSKRAYAHYALPALAALAALAGGGVGRLRAAADSSRRRLAVALLATACLTAAGAAARSLNASHTASGLSTLADDVRLASSLRSLAPEGAEVVCTWPFAQFANRYRSPLRFHYDLAFTVPGEYWLEEWRNLGRRGSPVNLLHVRSRRNVYDMAGPLWNQLVPGESVGRSSGESVLRPLVLPPVLWYARPGDRDMRLAVGRAPIGSAVVLRGTTEADAVLFESQGAETARVAVRPGAPFRALFPAPREAWQLARATVTGGRRVVWEGAEAVTPAGETAGYDSRAPGATR